MADPQPFAKLPRGLAPLGYRDFTLFWVGLVVTTTGRWIELTGLVWLVYNLTESPFFVGLLGASRAVPAFSFSLFAGVIADRANQRMMLFATQACGLVASFVLGVLILTGSVELWHIYVQVVIQSIITSFDASARQAMFPRLVPRAILPEAVTLATTAGRVSKFLGPALGGLLIADFGEASPFLVNAASFVGLMVALLYIQRLPAPVRLTITSFGSEMKEGLRYIWSAPILSGILKLEIVYAIFETNPAIIAIVGRELLDTGPRELGFLLAAPAFGSLFGIAWLLYVGSRRRLGRFSLCSMMACCFAMGLFALSTSYVVSFVALSLVGLLDVMMTVTRNTIMQLTAPAHMRGRVMANMGLVTRGIAPLSETQSGVLASSVSARFAVLTAAAVIGLAAGFTALTNRKFWRFSLDSQ